LGCPVAAEETPPENFGGLTESFYIKKILPGSFLTTDGNLRTPPRR
jgi:hypothetical protein